MTPAEHYAEAEHWIAQLDALDEDDPAALRAYQTYLLRAQVHATLATAKLGGYDGRWKFCTCPKLETDRSVRTSVDPGCPVHGLGSQAAGDA
jgi:hypothetical protein